MKSITYTNGNGKSITFGESPPFYLEYIDASSISTSRSTYKAIGQDGQSSGDITYNPRTIVCKLAYNGVLNDRYDTAEMLRNWQLITSVFLPKSAGELVYTNDLGTYKIACCPFDLPNYETVVATLGKFTIDFVADYPFWQSNEIICFRLGEVVGGFSFPFSFNPTVQFGTWVKTCTIENDTGIETPFIVEIDTVSDYAILSNEKGEFIKVDRAIADGQKLVVNTLDMTVKLVNADGSFTYANNKVSLDSTYFKLHDGTNILTLDNGKTTPATASICYNKLYLGA